MAGVSASRAIDLLAPLGLVVMAGAFIASRYGVALPGGLGPWIAAGAALMLVHLVLRWESVTRAVGARQLRHGGNSAVLIAAASVPRSAAGFAFGAGAIRVAGGGGACDGGPCAGGLADAEHDVAGAVAGVEVVAC